MDFTHVFLPQSSYMLHTFHHSQLRLRFPPPSTLTHAQLAPGNSWKCIDRLAKSSNSALDEINRQCSCQLLLSTVITTHCAALEPRKSEYKSPPTYLLQVGKYLQHIYALPLLKVPAHTSPTTTLPLPSNKGCRHGFSLSKDSGMRVGRKTGGENHGIDIHQVHVE